MVGGGMRVGGGMEEGTWSTRRVGGRWWYEGRVLGGEVQRRVGGRWWYRRVLGGNTRRVDGRG